MRPREFQLNNLIQFPFGESKISEISRVLRPVGLFPKGNRHDFYTHVSINEAVLFLYLIASETPAKFVKDNIDTFLNLKTEDDKYFFESLSSMFYSPTDLMKIENVEIGCQLRFGIIRYKDGKIEKFGVPERWVQKNYRLPGNFLIDFAMDLYSEDVEYSKIPEKGKTIDSMLTEAFNNAPKSILSNKPSRKELKYILKNWENFKEEE